MNRMERIGRAPGVVGTNFLIVRPGVKGASLLNCLRFNERPHDRN